MSKIISLEEKRERSTAKALVFLYNTAVLVSIVMLVTFVNRTLSVNILGNSAQEGLNVSFFRILLNLYGLFKGIYSFASEMTSLLYQTSSIIIQLYYYYIVAVFSIIIILQRTFTTYVKQSRRGA